MNAMFVCMYKYPICIEWHRQMAAHKCARQPNRLSASTDIYCTFILTFYAFFYSFCRSIFVHKFFFNGKTCTVAYDGELFRREQSKMPRKERHFKNGLRFVSFYWKTYDVASVCDGAEIKHSTPSNDTKTYFHFVYCFPILPTSAWAFCFFLFFFTFAFLCLRRIFSNSILCSHVVLIFFLSRHFAITNATKYISKWKCMSNVNGDVNFVVDSWTSTKTKNH